MTSDMQLKRFYNRANTLYFNGELPSDLLIWWEPAGSGSADTIPLETEPGHPTELGIRIDPAMKLLWRHARQDILHEMVHVKLWDYRGLKDHARRFHAEIKRLCGYSSYRKLL